jgi:hypothetical protein
MTPDLKLTQMLRQHRGGGTVQRVREMFSYIISNQMVEGSVCIGLRARLAEFALAQLSVAHDARQATRKAPLIVARNGSRCSWGTTQWR